MEKVYNVVDWFRFRFTMFEEGYMRGTRGGGRVIRDSGDNRRSKVFGGGRWIGFE